MIVKPSYSDFEAVLTSFRKRGEVNHKSLTEIHSFGYASHGHRVSFKQNFTITCYVVKSLNMRLHLSRRSS